MAIYPNPTAKTLNVVTGNITGNETVSAMIFDATGKYVKGMTLNNVNASFSFDVSNLPNGIYILRVVANGETSVWRFIKQ